MTTRKLLTAFNPQEPDTLSRDFLVVVMRGSRPTFWGLSSGQKLSFGLLVHIGKEIKADELFAKLVDTGSRINNVEKTMRILENYIEMLQGFRIGSVLGIEPAIDSEFKLIRLSDRAQLTEKPILP